MHDRLNRHELAYDEPYTYHPHITLAQELPQDCVAEAFELATRRWQEFPFTRRFPLDHVTFVQNTIQKQWLDLKEVPLAEPAPVARV
jgi:2'-5' RNA ligase